MDAYVACVHAPDVYTHVAETWQGSGCELAVE